MIADAIRTLLDANALDLESEMRRRGREDVELLVDRLCDAARIDSYSMLQTRLQEERLRWPR